MAITKKNFNGSITISDIVKNHLVKKIYFGYTKKEAVRLFNKEFNMKG